MEASRIAMGGPADLRMHSDAPVRLFTVMETNALIPRLELLFRRIDPAFARLRELRDLIDDAEAYWGEGLTAAPSSTSPRTSGPRSRTCAGSVARTASAGGTPWRPASPAGRPSRPKQNRNVNNGPVP